MSFININTSKFMKIPNINETKCKTNNTFIARFTDLLLYHYEIYNAGIRVFTKKKSPYIIGFNGSVSSGKSYISDKCSEQLNKNCNVKTIVLSTDNFIFPNKKLEKMGIMHRKGFPESYDMIALKKVIIAIKQNKSVKVPIYDQSISDISKKRNTIPVGIDIVILEGINILQTNNLITANKMRVILSDYIDLSIYIDAHEKAIIHWFLERLEKKKTHWKKKGIKRNLTKKNNRKFKKWGVKIWNDINKVNLEKFILPFKERADIILFKNKNHRVTKMAIRI